MKVHINKYGTLILTPENDTEHYALGQWFDASAIKREGTMYKENNLIKTSCISIEGITDKNRGRMV